MILLKVASTHTEGQSWKKLHAAHAVRADIFVRIEDILVQKSRTYVKIANMCADSGLIWGKFWEMRNKIIIWG